MSLNAIVVIAHATMSKANIIFMFSLSQSKNRFSGKKIIESSSITLFCILFANESEFKGESSKHRCSFFSFFFETNQLIHETLQILFSFL